MTSTRKNILFISFDDCISFSKYKSCFGEKLQIPNLDRICEQSTAFNSAYCQAPVCGPSRASFMTGRMPHQSKVFDNYDDVFSNVPAEEFWTANLKENGYFCSSGGKVHHKYKPVRREYHKILYSDERKHFTNDMKLPGSMRQKKYGGHRGGRGTLDEKDDPTYYDHQVADSAISFLETYDKDQPFYREVGFYSPHGPHYTPARFKEMYNVKEFHKPESWQGGFDENAYADKISPPNMDPTKNKWWQSCVRNYFSALSHGDYHLGRVWDALKASRHAENTIVIIVSDHGFHLGNLNRFKKTTLWEQVAGVPLIIHDPSRPEAREIQAPVAMIDVGPTVEDYCDVAPKFNGFGKSLRTFVEGGSTPDRVIPTFFRNNAAIRKGKYRLIRYIDGSTQLYDLEKDYWQLHNLGTEHEQFPAMMQALVECCQECGYDININETVTSTA